MDMIARLLLLFPIAALFAFASTPPSVNAVLNSASLSPGPLAPGALAVVTGSGLSDESESASDSGLQQLPTKLGGVQVFFYGRALPLLSVSPTQVQFQLPYGIDSVSWGTIYVRTEHADGRMALSNGMSIEIAPAAPGIFALGGTEPRAGLILHAQTNGSVQAGAPVTANNPARPGETLIVWAAGLGDVAAGSADDIARAGVPLNGVDAAVLNTVEATINGRPVPVISAALPQGAVGVYEVRLQLPDDLMSDAKAHLALVQNGGTSNTVVFPLQSSNR